MDTAPAPQMMEWVQLLLRWLHVVAGVFWVGQTALFAFLDRRFTVEGARDPGEPVWLVHSGGFYAVERRPRPVALPPVLHWFKWEAAVTWSSGFLLLVLMYHLGGAMVEPGGPLGPRAAAALGSCVLLAGWLLYDALWISPLARRDALAQAISLVLLLAIAWSLASLLTGRAAYMHVGALMGTIMAANVWVRILPAQRQMVAALGAGRAPDAALAARAKQRSQHNGFLAIPLLFIMISNHYPSTTYGRRLAWMILAALIGVGLLARWAINRWEAR